MLFNSTASLTSLFEIVASSDCLGNSPNCLFNSIELGFQRIDTRKVGNALQQVDAAANVGADMMQPLKKLRRKNAASDHLSMSTRA